MVERIERLLPPLDMMIGKSTQDCVNVSIAPLREYAIVKSKEKTWQLAECESVEEKDEVVVFCYQEYHKVVLSLGAQTTENVYVRTPIVNGEGVYVELSDNKCFRAGLYRFQLHDCKNHAMISIQPLDETTKTASPEATIKWEYKRKEESDNAEELYISRLFLKEKLSGWGIYDQISTKTHLVLKKQYGKFFIRDNYSRNGTFYQLGDRSVEVNVKYNPDIIISNNFVMVFHDRLLPPSMTLTSMFAYSISQELGLNLPAAVTITPDGPNYICKSTPELEAQLKSSRAFEGMESSEWATVVLQGLPMNNLLSAERPYTLNPKLGFWHINLTTDRTYRVSCLMPLVQNAEYLHYLDGSVMLICYSWPGSRPPFQVADVRSLLWGHTLGRIHEMSGGVLETWSQVDFQDSYKLLQIETRQLGTDPIPEAVGYRNPARDSPRKTAPFARRPFDDILRLVSELQPRRVCFLDGGDNQGVFEDIQTRAKSLPLMQQDKLQFEYCCCSPLDLQDLKGRSVSEQLLDSTFSRLMLLPYETNIPTAYKEERKDLAVFQLDLIKYCSLTQPLNKSMTSVQLCGTKESKAFQDTWKVYAQLRKYRKIEQYSLNITQYLKQFGLQQFTFEDNSPETYLADLLWQFSDVFREAYTKLEPSLLCSYLCEVASRANSAFEGWSPSADSVSRQQSLLAEVARISAGYLVPSS